MNRGGRRKPSTLRESIHQVEPTEEQFIAEGQGSALEDLSLALSGGFPSTPTVHDSGDFSDQGRLWSSSGAYFLIGTGEGGVAVSLSGLNGGPVALNSALRLKLVRLF